MSPYQCEQEALEHTARVTPDLQLLHAPESEGVETPGPFNKPITLHKVYDDKKLCLFPTQLWGQMRRTTQRGSGTPHTRLCRALSSFQARVWGFCLALGVPGGSKQPAKNSSRTKQAGRDGKTTANSWNFWAVTDNAELNGANAFITRSKQRPVTTDDLIQCLVSSLIRLK